MTRRHAQQHLASPIMMRERIAGRDNKQRKKKNQKTPKKPNKQIED
jgi:hypothetical protein